MAEIILSNLAQVLNNYLYIYYTKRTINFIIQIITYNRSQSSRTIWWKSLQRVVPIVSKPSRTIWQLLWRSMLYEIIPAHYSLHWKLIENGGKRIKNTKQLRAIIKLSFFIRQHSNHELIHQSLSCLIVSHW